MTVAIVVTSINPPTKAMVELASQSARTGSDFIVIGDSKSPPDFALENASYYNIEAQCTLPFGFARACPTGHYARKNIGYLMAIRQGAHIIVETDDDNAPLPGFWEERSPRVKTPVVSGHDGWINVYQYYTDNPIWPRGMPLDRIKDAPPALSSLPIVERFCPIQQGLADGDPDVDAIYRLVLPLPIHFLPKIRVCLDRGAWCPFNSQNTAWWPVAYPLLYLPYHCSFRMTDIWRSFVAQRIAWENGWSLLFHSPTVYQDRNEHDLMRDFTEELPGYLQNQRIVDALMDLDLVSGVTNIPANMLNAYRALIAMDLVGEQEIVLLRAWLADIQVLVGQ